MRVCAAMGMLSILFCGMGAWAKPPVPPEHITSPDYSVIDDAFMFGFERNRVTDTVGGREYPILAIQSVNEGKRAEDLSPNRFFSCWTRDVYWGFLGYTQASEREALARLGNSIDLFLIAKTNNIADGTNKVWPLNDGRSYIPQAILPRATTAKDFYPFNSESQAHFVLLVHLYWRMTGDLEAARHYWQETRYVLETIERMDSNGNALPDQCWGSYDYQGIGLDMEEPLLCATVAGAYHAAAELAAAFGDDALAARYNALAEKVRTAMNVPTEQGGLWKTLPNGGGYYVNRRHIGAKTASIDERFIPYENLVPIYFGMASPEQTQAVFAHLDAHFNDYYLFKHGPMYTAPIAERKPETVHDCSTTPWLGFLDVYLRCRTGAGDLRNRTRIWQLLLAHAYDIADAPFTEGLGIFGTLTGGAGRLWDNGNFFHTLVCGVYGLEKFSAGIRVGAPGKMLDAPRSCLNGMQWRDAVYDFRWEGKGTRVQRVRLDGRTVRPGDTGIVLNKPRGYHRVVIELVD